MNKTEISFINFNRPNYYFSANQGTFHLNNYGHGKYRITAQSAEYISAFISKLRLCINQEQDVSFIFTEFGAMNAFRIIDAMCRNEFIAYYINFTEKFISTPFNRGFYALLDKLTGNKTHLWYNVNLLLWDIMKSTYLNMIEQKEKSENSALLKMDSTNENALGINVSCVKYYNNYLFITVNGYSFKMKKKNTNDFSLNDFYEACYKIKEVINNKEDIKALVSDLGSVFIYNVTNAVCPDETLDYFKFIADRTTKQRDKIYPVKLLKSLKLKSRIASDTSPILERILDLLEQEAFKQNEVLVDGNINELEKKSVWKMYYLRKKALYFNVFDFTRVKNSHVAYEFRTYLKEKAKLIGLDNIGLLRRAYYDIGIGLSALLTNNLCDSLSSITKISYADAMLMRARLVQCNKYSPYFVAEIINYMDNFFLYTASCMNEIVTSPFENLRIIKKNKFSKNTEPISNEALDIIYKNFELMPQIIKMAFLIYLETGVRGDDVCNLSVTDIKLDDDGRKYLHVTLSKTGLRKRINYKPDFVNHKITLELAHMIDDFIEDYKDLRRQLDTDLIFVYRVGNYRENSKRMPRVLTSETFDYYLKLLLELCNARKADGSLETATCRQIRAAIGRRLFKEGKAASEVAAVLGNTPSIASVSYNKMSHSEECETYNNLYNESLSNLITSSYTQIKLEAYQNNAKRKVLYGMCGNQRDCDNQNDCENCNILKRKKYREGAYTGEY